MLHSLSTICLVTYLFDSKDHLYNIIYIRELDNRLFLSLFRSHRQSSELPATARDVRAGSARAENWANCDQASAVATTQPALAMLPAMVLNIKTQSVYIE